MGRGRKLLLIAPLAIGGMALFIFLGGEIVKLLWNWLAPSIFGLRPLTFWEATGLLALCRILFGGIAGRGLVGRNVNDNVERRRHNRERLRQRIRERFGFDDPNGEVEPPRQI